MTPTQQRIAPTAKGTQLAPAARRAAARMVVAADKASGRDPDPRIVAIAEGHFETPESS